MLAINVIGSYGRDYRIIVPSDRADFLLGILSHAGYAAWISRP